MGSVVTLGGRGFRRHDEAADLCSAESAIKFFEESIGDRPMRPLSSWPSVLGEVFRVDAMADLEGVAVGDVPQHRPHESTMVFCEVE